ncbi:hypothetical protein LTSEINV_1449 [Salmonella enterica subsp. enterica serovar Inverness str. R8-3668]|uniref:Uncharacterized protein n=1 Tax=Salmonella enterica subsp. enterica serovar Inverness str. R8-3668 TaxID=913075 RepID=G5NAG2_SALET|nr:hypothetical protein LTSEINV_1449 [Salmonella enterica subsp. enterica serovar Inverness str. R8-3668]
MYKLVRANGGDTPVTYVLSIKSECMGSFF